MRRDQADGSLPLRRQSPPCIVQTHRHTVVPKLGTRRDWCVQARDLEIRVGGWGPIALHVDQPRRRSVATHGQRCTKAFAQNPWLAAFDLQHSPAFKPKNVRL